MCAISKKEYNRKYFQEHKEEAYVRDKKWKENNPEKYKGIHKKWQDKNKEHHSKKSKEWYKKNRTRKRILGDERIKLCIKSWENYFPKKSKCQICGKELYFKGHHITKTIHFDHRKGECEIKRNPSSWISRKYYSEKNRKIWESCDFGILCNRCNMILPTIGRKKWLRKVVKYVNS